MKKITLLLLSSSFLTTVFAQTTTTFVGTAGTQGTTQGSSSSSFTSATFDTPRNLFVHKQSGRVWIVEAGGNRVRMIDQITSAGTATVYNRAGSPAGNAGAAEGTGVNASFESPGGIVTDTLGTIYVADKDNHAIRKITPFTSVGNVQTVSTFAGTKGSTGGFADSIGTAAQFNAPYDLAIDAGNTYLYVADAGNNRIRRIELATGAVTTLAGSGTAGSADGTGTAATFTTPTGLAWWSATELLVADWAAHKIRKINVNTGIVTTVAGTGTPGNSDGDVGNATLFFPSDMAVDNNGIIYITCGSSVIRQIQGSCVTTFAGTAGSPGTANGSGATARFDMPSGIIFHENTVGAYLYVCDEQNHTIRRISVPSNPATAKPVIVFSASRLAAAVNDTIVISDSSLNAPNAWQWEITPASYTLLAGSLGSSLMQLQFTAAGLYTVKLKASNCWGTDSLTKTSYINIGSTGAAEVNLAESIRLFPNPAHGTLNVHSEMEADLSIVDLQGRIVREVSGVRGTATIDLADLAPGMYLVHVSNGSSAAVKKLVIE